MKNKNFYNVVNKTKLLKVFENNKVMYETYFGGNSGPKFERFWTATYYKNQPTRVNDLITNIDLPQIRPPQFMNYSHSTYQLPEGQTEYLNGTFEQIGHPIEAKGFTVEFTLTKRTKVVVNVGSPSDTRNAEAAVINSKNEFVPATKYESPITEIQTGLYSVPSAQKHDFKLEITYDLRPGTYRLGTPCKTLTEGLRIYGILEDCNNEAQERVLALKEELSKECCKKQLSTVSGEE